jgi:hypothetical protein
MPEIAIDHTTLDRAQQGRPEKRLKITTGEEANDASDYESSNSPPPSSSSTSSTPPTIPTFSKTYDSVEFSKAFDKYQAVYLPNFSRSSKAMTKEQQQQQQQQQLSWKDLSGVFSNLSKEDQETWCIETAPSAENSEKPKQQQNNNTDKEEDSPTIIEPVEFLREWQNDNNDDNDEDKKSCHSSSSAYCSFLVQKDLEGYQRLLRRLPVQTVVDGDEIEWDYEPCIWIFFGRNNNNNNTTKGEDLQGRPEHTDSISHDGTWHYQLSGIKRWCLRPTAKLLQHIREHDDDNNDDDDNNLTESSNWDESTRIQIDCRAGDIIVVNTRLWHHRTIIPSNTTTSSQREPSVSYARDFWADKKKNRAAKDRCATMTNVDGLYATNDIEEGTIVFKEADMPDCELHRSKDNPNCQIVELKDGSGAVVSLRPIAAGEFFCVPESSDEEEEEESDYDEEEEEEGEVSGVEE